LPEHVGMHEMLIEPRDQMFGDPTAMGVAPEGMYAPQNIDVPDNKSE